MAEEREERERALLLLNEEFDKRLAELEGLRGSVDSRATFLVGAVAVVVPIFLGLDREWVVSALAAVAYAVTFGLGLWTIWPVDFKTTPAPDGVIQRYREALKSPANVREQMLGILVGSKGEMVDQNA